jgi:hypothetical protein
MLEPHNFVSFPWFSCSHINRIYYSILRYIYRSILHLKYLVSVAPLGISRHRRIDNIKMDLREIGWGCMDWIYLAQYRDQWRAIVNMIINLRVP